MSKQLASVSIGSELSLFNGTIPIGASISFQPEDKYFDYGREMCGLFLYHYLFQITTFAGQMVGICLWNGKMMTMG